MFTNPASQPQVPLPVLAGTGGVAGVDPTIQTGLGASTTIVGVRGQHALATISISDSANGLLSADLVITYDTSLLDLTSGTSGTDVTLGSTLSSAAGEFPRT